MIRKHILALLIFCTLSTLNVKASHLFGGEITWICIKSGPDIGKFQFTLKVYRDCNGVIFTPPSAIQVYGNPLVTSIPINAALTVITDLSPAGCGFSCANPSDGATQEFIMKTNPVFLNGTPPATGWVFAIDDCCRNSLVNVGGGGQGFTIRAVMYPFNGQNMNPCYDSSPFFKERPNTYICIGYPYTYNPTAVDPELDSLYSDWAYPLDLPSTTPPAAFNAPIINFTAPYTVNSQLPGNVTMNHQSGEITFFVTTASGVTGNFATCLKVTAYKCNQKVAEIFRDYGVVLITNCFVQNPPTINLPPAINLPFAGGTVKDTTVHVGDTVRFRIDATDFQKNIGSGAAFQTIRIDAYGDQFGSPINTNSGCQYPPCAKFDKLTPVISPLAAFINFEWVTTCDHIIKPSGCLRERNTYYFIIKAQDNYCNAPAISTITISVTVIQSKPLEPPHVRGASVLNTAGDVGLYWETPGVVNQLDTHHVFNSYQIYASNNFGGPFTLVDSVAGNKDFYKQKGDTITATQLNTLIGANANNAPVYFYVKTKSLCNGDSISVASDTISTMFVSSTLVNCETQLNWNSLFNHAYPGSAGLVYKIYREHPIGSPPVQIATVPNTWPNATYTDPFSKTVCRDSVKYYVSIDDTLIIIPTPTITRCVSKSNVIKKVIDNRFTANISPAGPTNLCPPNCVNITASANPSPACFTTSYLWSNGATTATITACNAGAYSAVITQSPSGCTSTTPSHVVTLTPGPTANIAISGVSNVCPGDSVNLQFTFAGGAPYTYSYNVPGPGCVGTTVVNAVANSSPVIVRVPVNCNFNYTLNSVMGACAGTVSGSANATIKALPTASVVNTANDTVCNGGGSTISLAFTGTGPWNYVIKSNTGPDITATTASNPVSINVSPTSTTTYTLFSVQDACIGTVSGTRKIVVLPVPTAAMSITGNDTICSGSSTTIRVDFTGTGPFVGNIKDNTTGVLTPVNTAATFITLNVSPNSTTTYSFQNFTSSNKACPGTISNSIVVAVKAIPTANISSVTNATICKNDSVRMQVSFTGNGAPYSFGLVTNAGAPTNVNATSNPYYFYVHPISNTNYIVTTVSDAFCSKTNINDTVAVTVNQLPTAVLSGTTTICAGQPATLTINFTGTGPFTGSCVASTGGTINFNTSANPYTFNVSPSATTTYSLSATINDAKCSNNTNPATAIVTVNALPQASISGNKTICTGENDTLLVNFTAGNAPWTFYYKDGLGNTYGPVTTSNNPYKVVVSPTATTTFQLDSVFSGVCKGSVNGISSVTVRPLPTATFTTSNDTICNGNATNLTIQFTGTAPFSYQLQGQAVQNAATNPVTISVNPTTTTNYTLVQVNDQLCTSTTNQQIKVTVLNLPTATLSTTTPNLCVGTSGSITINFTGNGPFTTAYSNGTVNTPVVSNTNSIVIPVSPTVNTTYSLVGNVNSMYGCNAPVNPATALITVRPLPTMTISGSPIICESTSANFNIAFTGTAPFNYSYFNGTANINGTTSTNPLTVTVSPPVGTTTYTPVSITDQYCTGTALNGSSVVKVNPKPTATLFGNDTICVGSSSFIAIKFVGTPPFDYSYTTNGVSSGSLSSPVDSVSIPVAPNVNTTYVLSTSISDANCSNSNINQSVYMKVTPIPTVTISGTNAICSGGSTNLTLNFTGEAPYTYSYLAGGTSVGPFTTNNTSVTIPVSPTSNTNYTLPATVNGNGCNGPASGNAMITVNAIPQAVITTAKDSICKGDSTQLSIQFTGTAPFTYQLQGQGVSNATSNPHTFYVSPQSNTSYVLTNITDNNCPAVINQNIGVKVLDNPTVAITTATPSLCKGNPGSITLNFTANGPYNVTYNDGTSNFPVTSTSNSVTIPVTPTATTTYTLSGVVTGLLGCKTSATGSTTVTVHELPQAVISGNPVICLNEIAPIQIQFTGTAPFNYSYQNNVTGQINNGTTSQNPLTINLSPTTTTSYNLTAISDKNCPGTQISGLANITVNPLPQPVITGVNAVCEGTPSVLSTTLPYTSYQWSNTGTGSTTTVTATGNYTVQVTDNNGCKNTSPSFAFIAHPYPVVNFTNDTSKTCQVPRVNYFNQSLYQPGATFSWILGDNATSNEVNPSHIYSQPGTYNVQLVVTNPFGCKDSIEKPVEVIFYPLPVAQFTANPMVTNIFNGPVSFTDQSAYAVSWKWVFGEGDTLYDQNVTHYFPEIGEFPVKLMVENISGCKDETQQTIVINPFWLPNAFTPNGDGRNEVFFDPGFAMEYSGFNLRVFNRWGQMLFQSDSPSKPWDGTNGKGEIAPQGTYVYTLSVTNKGGKRHDFNGTITLLR
ncbi:MAG TPA: PKD domain-containing protein [Bacteroidia bacterium]|nr:PKD domain-containing protein [Bacteroidia bacterium]